jgi:hypothetical protein
MPGSVKKRKKKRKRKLSDLPDNWDAPPPTADEGGWSAKKTLLVLGGVLGVPLLLLLIFVGSGILKAIGTGLAVMAVIALRLLRYAWWAERFHDD